MPGFQMDSGVLPQFLISSTACGTGDPNAPSRADLHCTFAIPSFVSMTASQFEQRAMRIELNLGKVFS
jgi:hypothetical protein